MSVQNPKMDIAEIRSQLLQAEVAVAHMAGEFSVLPDSKQHSPTCDAVNYLFVAVSRLVDVVEELASQQK